LIRGLSCADYGWPSLRHEVVMAVISDLGFSGVDVGVFGDATHITVSDLMNRHRHVIAEAQENLELYGVACSDVFLTPSLDLESLTPSHPSAADQAESLLVFERAVTFADALGSSGLTMTPGVVHSGDTHTEAIARSAAALKTRLEIARSHGLGLSVEPHWGSCIDTADRINELITRVDGLQITLDVSMMIYTGFSIEEILVLVPHVRHVQLRAGDRNRVQVRVRDNEFPFDRLIRALLDVSYEGWLATEFVWMEKWGCDRVDVTEETSRLRSVVLSILELYDVGLVERRPRPRTRST
jgi:sugar phosphate isomerase/epimerase